MADPGFSRGSQPQRRRVGCQPITRPNFPNNYMKTTKIGPRGKGWIKFVYVDPPLFSDRWYLPCLFADVRFVFLAGTFWPHVGYSFSF